MCGEYMRASGFFYSTDETVYLITARHNCLPTNGRRLKTGGQTANFQTNYSLSKIDVYLRTPSGFDVEQVDITVQDGVIQTPEIDVLCVPIDFAPDEYGYHVYEQVDITSPQDAGASVNSVGFNKKGFPDSSKSYDSEMYRNQLGNPSLLSLENEISGEVDGAKYGLMPPAIDAEFVGNNDDYNGLSGAPIIGDELIGIHSQNKRPPAHALKQNGLDEFVFIVYTRADVLPKLLS